MPSFKLVLKVSFCLLSTVARSGRGMILLLLILRFFLLVLNEKLAFLLPSDLILAFESYYTYLMVALCNSYPLSYFSCNSLAESILWNPNFTLRSCNWSLLGCLSIFNLSLSPSVRAERSSAFFFSAYDYWYGFLSPPTLMDDTLSFCLNFVAVCWSSEYIPYLELSLWWP